jgi:sirohydrochlorin ferrochelatase
MRAMTDRADNERQALGRLKAALIDDILAASDESILAEAKQDGLDPRAVAAGVRALFEKTVAAGNKAALEAAKAAVAADRGRSATVVPFDPTAGRRRLAQLLEQNPDTARTLTIAARKGTSGEFSDDEVQGLLEDFEDLGIAPYEEPGGER